MGEGGGSTCDINSAAQIPSSTSGLPLRRLHLTRQDKVRRTARILFGEGDELLVVGHKSIRLEGTNVHLIFALLCNDKKKKACKVKLGLELSPAPLHPHSEQIEGEIEFKHRLGWGGAAGGGS